ncbi:MAG: prepilin peptidase [Syntrophales bacterium]|nr:prepilin peptidase [Syntrophales bacterium]
MAPLDALTFLVLAAFVVGSVVGSFLNVVIHRLPAEQSVVKPPSHCPACGSPIRFYDNIPILSYLILRGRCRHCRDRISPRYPLVEALTGVMAVLLVVKFGLGLKMLVAFTFVAVLIVITFIDLDHQIIPHALTLPGIPLFLLAGVAVMGVRLGDALFGLFAGIAVLYLVALYYESLTGNEGMGGGDVNLLGMIGAFFGWQSLLVVLLVGSLAGAVVGAVLILVKGRDLKYAVPFGPFLSLGAMVYLMWGPSLMRLWPLRPM